MGKYRNVMGNLYCNRCADYPFKDILYAHMNYHRSSIDRGWYKITDLKAYFESDGEEGEEYIIKRVSENGQYGLVQNMRCFL